MATDTQKALLADKIHALEIGIANIQLLQKAVQATDEAVALAEKQKDMQALQKEVLDLKKSIYG